MPLFFTAILIALFTGLSIGSAYAQVLPKAVKIGANYDIARKALKRNGFKPGVSAIDHANFCLSGDPRCAQYPESSTCAGTGFAPCLMIWKRHDRKVEIITQGEGPLIIKSIKQ